MARPRFSQLSLSNMHFHLLQVAQDADIAGWHDLTSGRVQLFKDARGGNRDRIFASAQDFLQYAIDNGPYRGITLFAIRCEPEARTVLR